MKSLSFDWHLGRQLEGESFPGQSKRTFSVPIGIELPLFDRNQHEIAKAFNERDLQLVIYQAELSRSIAELEEEYALLRLIDQKRQVFKDEIIPAATKNTAAGKRALELGSIDVLRYLDLVAQLRRRQMEHLNLDGERLDSVIRIEELTGTPLVKFD